MTRLLICSLLVGFAWTSMAAEALGQKSKANDHVWRRDYRAALDEARRSGKPLFVVFRCEP